ncbi:MAG: PEP-CTERM sorting domain-containing protein [Armatimonadetes bacterium]|nr:PEP-CTERM sorting domain-containing protein [Armatimonadota bacterium]
MKRNSQTRLPMLLAVATVSSTALAQVSTMYVTDGTGSVGYTHMLQGGSEIGAYQWTGPAQIPIWVGPTVRQAYYIASGGPGMEYTLGGVATGYGNNWNNGGIQAYDAASDGKNVFMVDWGSGQVKSWGLNYEGPGNVLFNASQYDLGITYDSKRNEIWTSNWITGNLEEWSMNGTLLSVTGTGGNLVGALGYDAADDSLWMKDNSRNAMLQFSAGTHAYLNSYGYQTYVLGGEFGTSVTPEPTSMAALGLGVVALLKRRKK